ncbi:MAG: hypothetical protein WD872_07475 [Pirellulaceae bacterium]
MNRALLRLLLLVCLPTICHPTSGFTQDLPEPAGDPTVIGQVEHLGWGLVGSRGRHYVFGGIAMADYRDSAGTRRIVAMQHQDHIQDARHLYYRELRDAHRWAFSRQRNTDGKYGVWFQLAPTAAAPNPKWQSFHRARLEVGSEPRGVEPTPVSTTTVAAAGCCGR